MVRARDAARAYSCLLCSRLFIVFAGVARHLSQMERELGWSGRGEREKDTEKSRARQAMNSFHETKSGKVTTTDTIRHIQNKRRPIVMHRAKRKDRSIYRQPQESSVAPFWPPPRWTPGAGRCPRAACSARRTRGRSSARPERGRWSLREGAERV